MPLGFNQLAQNLGPVAGSSTCDPDMSTTNCSVISLSLANTNGINGNLVAGTPLNFFSYVNGAWQVYVAESSYSQVLNPLLSNYPGQINGVIASSNNNLIYPNANLSVWNMYVTPPLAANISALTSAMSNPNDYLLVAAANSLYYSELGLLLLPITINSIGSTEVINNIQLVNGILVVSTGQNIYYTTLISPGNFGSMSPINISSTLGSSTLQKMVLDNNGDIYFTLQDSNALYKIANTGSLNIPNYLANSAQLIATVNNVRIAGIYALLIGYSMRWQ